MPKSCCIVGCTNNSAKREDLSFYMIPSEATEPERREKWLQVIGRRASPGSAELWRPKSDYHYVCSSHFTQGKKNNSPAHPDYVPSIFPQIAVKDSANANGNQHNHFKRTQKSKIQTSATVSTNRVKSKRWQVSGNTTTKSEESPSHDSSLPCVHVETDVQQLFVRKDEILPEEEEWSHILPEKDLNPPSIKEEQEQVWISQEGEQHHQLEDDDIISFPFTGVPVKSENNEEDSHLSHHQSQTNENTLEPVVNSPTEDVKIEVKLEDDGDTYGGSELSSDSGPNCHLEVQTNDKTLDCSDTETDDSWDWKKTGDQAGFNKKQLSCCQCGKTFGRMNNLRVHARIHTGEKPFSCTECSKRFVQKGALKRHMRSHTGEKPFSCSDCGKAFGFMNLREHKKIHSGEKPFNCTECGKRFMQKGNLKNHMRIHTGEKLLGCPECDKRFGRKGDLKRHMRIHTGEKLFHCSECGKTFGQQGALKSHMRIHTGEKQFSCSVCCKRFGQKGSLKRHMIIHTGEKLFSCSLCGKKFGQKGELVRHVTIHTGQKEFSCSMCGKTFGQKSRLTIHMRIHTEDCTFRCSECGKKFGQMCELKRHVRFHIGEKQFSCSECGKRFGQSSDLKRHRRVHKTESS